MPRVTIEEAPEARCPKAITSDHTETFKAIKIKGSKAFYNCPKHGKFTYEL